MLLSLVRLEGRGLDGKVLKLFEDVLVAAPAPAVVDVVVVVVVASVAACRRSSLFSEAPCQFSTADAESICLFKYVTYVPMPPPPGPYSAHWVYPAHWASSVQLTSMESVAKWSHAVTRAPFCTHHVLTFELCQRPAQVVLTPQFMALAQVAFK